MILQILIASQAACEGPMVTPKNLDHYGCTNGELKILATY